MDQQSTTRFSNRVEDYVKYRPSYPLEIISFLQQKYRLSTDKLIADVGAGTGISSELFLKAGYQVLAVEPNKEMRQKAVELLSHHPKFSAVDGTAEQTNVDGNHIDAIISGQAFHWFDVPKAKVEFQRVLKTGGLVVLIWNERLTASEFEQDYDCLLIKHARDYVKVDHRNIDDVSIGAFYCPYPFELKLFPNQQVFDFEGLKGRLLSSSYMPTKDDDGYQGMIDDLEALFALYNEEGKITINYDTKVYVGCLK